MKKPAPTSRIQAVVFDYGGVIAGPASLVFDTALATALGTSLTEFRTCWAEIRPQVTSGHLEDEDAFWREMISRLGSTRSVDEVRRRIGSDDLAGSLDPEVMAMARRMKEGGVIVAILSNAPRALRHDLPEEVTNLFDPIMISAELGVVKPEPAIFELLAESLRLPPGRILLVDDLEANASAALASGLDAVVYRDAPTLRADLTARGLL